MASTPPTNEAFLREVDEELRRDQALGLWRRWGRWAIVGVVVILLGFAGYLGWRSYAQGAAGTEGEQLTQALDDLAAGRAATVPGRLETLAKSSADGQRAAAKLSLAALAVSKDDIKGAVRQYAAIAADASLAKPYRDAAVMRQTALEFDTMKPGDIVARLKPYAVAGNPWFGTAGEMLTIAYLRANQPAQACRCRDGA